MTGLGTITFKGEQLEAIPENNLRADRHLIEIDKPKSEIKIKYLRKSGDWRDCYELGESVSFQNYSEWEVMSVQYHPRRDITVVRLEREVQL